MRIAIIGLGRVGTALGILLRDAGHEIVSAYDATVHARRSFADRVSPTVVERLEDLGDGFQLVLIAVPDSCISGLSETLSRLPGFEKPLLVGHTSGALSSEELRHLADRGCSTFSLHPVQTFASVDAAVKAMPGSYFAVEGASDAVQTIEKNIVASIGSKCIRIDASVKPCYHASLSVASNFLVTLLNLALKLSSRAGLEPSSGYGMMLPLIKTTLRNFGESGKSALTGPIERADLVTIEKHLSAAAQLDASLCRLYIALARATVDLARDKGSIDPEASIRLKNMLEHYE